METASSEKNKRNIIMDLLIGLLSLAVLVLLFLISPLKDLVFDSTTTLSISLSVTESSGPDATTGLYRILVEADVEGKPDPQVTFNRNDGVGQVEANSSLLLLEEGETFLLKALAENSEGIVEAELEIFAGVLLGASSGRMSHAGSPGYGENGAPGAGNYGENERENDGETLPPEGDNENVNQAPIIREVRNAGRDERVFLHEAYPMCYRDDLHLFYVAIEDDRYAATGDIDLHVSASHGRVVEADALEIHSPDNIEIIYFGWLSPANPPGNRNDLDVQITLTASNPTATSGSEVINIILIVDHWLCDVDIDIPAVPEEGRPEDHFPLTETIEVTLRGIHALSGSVLSTGFTLSPDVVIGDSVRNEQSKGYITFNLAPVYNDIRGRNFEVESVSLDILNITRNGSPDTMAGNIDFKVFDYGTTLDAGDFRVGGTRFYNTRCADFYDPTQVSISSPTLYREVNTALNLNRPRFQIKIGLDVPTNNDGLQDTYHFFPNNAKLIIQLTVDNHI